MGPDQLVVVVCVRGDDPTCNKVENAAELTNRFLLQRSGFAGNGDEDNTPRASWTSPPKLSAGGMAGADVSSSSAEEYKIVRVDFAEHQRTADKYGVKSLPAFMMFQGGRLAWAGTLGGSPVKAAPPESAAAQRRILLVEPCAKVR